MTLQNIRLPASSFRFSIWALVFAAFCFWVATASTWLIHNSTAALGTENVMLNVIFVSVVIATALLFIPAFRSLNLSRIAEAARVKNDAVGTRIAVAGARDQAFITFGWGAFALLVFGFFTFIFMNEAAVGKTFFLLPLMQAKWWLVTTKFFTVNIVVFVFAEILVLVWGLAVALARLMPGAAVSRRSRGTSRRNTGCTSLGIASQEFVLVSLACWRFNIP